MQTNNLKYLKFVRFKEVERWDMKSLIGDAMRFRFPKCKLKEVLSKSVVEWVDIKDDDDYPILGVHAHGEGVYINNVSKGKSLTMKRYQKSKEMSLFYCKVRTVNGQWGIVFPEYANSYGSSNMQYLDIAYEKISPYYFMNLLKLEKLTKHWDKNAIGADGRHFTLETLMNLSFPLPTLTEQESLVSAYNSKIAEAEAKEAEAEKKSKEIEEYLLSELGIQKDEPNSNKTEESEGYLRFVRFKDVDRWDCYSEDISISSILKHAKYPIYQIGNVFEFVNRGWKKEEDYFRYVEIGSVDSLKGINSAEQLHTNKAPSRATQKIKKDDLIIGTTRPYLKKFAIVDEKYDDCVCSSGFQVIKPSNKYSLFFLLEYLMSFAAIKQFELYMTGALYPAITNTDLKKIQIPLPPLEIQNAIVAHISEQKEQIKQLKQEAKELRESALKEFENEIFG